MTTDFLGGILRTVTESEIGDGSTMSQQIFRAIEGGLGDDAGILFALLSNHDLAIQRFLDVARRNPGGNAGKPGQLTK